MFQSQVMVEEPKTQSGQQHMLTTGLKKFGEQGEKAMMKEVKQQHDRKHFQPMHTKDMTFEEQQKVQMALGCPTERMTK